MYQSQPQAATTRPQTLLGISDGPQGTLETLKHMRRLTREGKKSARVRQLALLLAAPYLHGTKKNYLGQICAIHFYVQNSIRYIKDICGVETLHTADAVLDLGAGDCDDKSILAASLLESIGHPTRFVAVATKAAGQFVHVYPETKYGQKWLPVETTEPWQLGRGPDPRLIRDKMVIHN